MKIKKFLSSELGKGSFILLITINLYNILNFLFHFSMGRMLGPIDYGTLAVLMSFIYIYSIPTEAIQNLVSRYISRFNSNGENGKIKFFMFRGLKKSVKISLWIFLLMGIASIFLAKILDINFWLIIAANGMIFFSFFSPITRGLLQGRKRFGKMGTALIIESLFKLGLAILFVILGFRVFGAMVGVVLGVLTGFGFSVYFNRDIIEEKPKKADFNGIYSFSIPYFISMIVIFIAFSIDIILAKIFFTAEIAGQYSVLSMLGKIIFFGTIAISKAMFPLTSERMENNKSSGELFKKSLLIIISLCIIAVLIYWIFPEQIISLLYGNQYIEMKSYLVYSGIALSFLSLSNLVLVYGLSTDRLKKPAYLFAFLFLEIVLLFLFHNSILEYIMAFMFSNIVMFICSPFFLKHG